MAARHRLITLFFVFSIVLATRAAKADCVTYDDAGLIPCGNGAGCEWELVICMYACNPGTCNPDGNSTVCCGHIKDYAQFYGGSDCEDCPDARFRVHTSVLHATPEHRAELLRGYTPGIIMLNAKVSYRPSQLVYTLNRCSHKYGLIIEDGRRITVGGM